jgi:hypothetical protein
MAGMQRTRRLGALALVSLLALALLPRFLIVVAPRADLFGHKATIAAAPNEPSVQIGEELTRGSIAVELLHGPLLSPLDYQYTRFFGGSLIVEVLAVPFFAVFGPRLWALKAVPVLFHLVAVLLTALLLDRFASRRAAWIGGLLMAFTPPGYTIVSTIAWGSHFESNTLALLAAYVFLDLCAAESGRGPRRLLLGVVMGFSIWFGYQCLVFVLAILALDLLRDRRSFMRPEMLAQVAGLAIGLVPWLVYNVRYDFTGLSIYGASLLEHVRPTEPHAGPLARLGALAFEGLPASFFFRGGFGLSGLAWGALASTVLAAGTMAAAWSHRAEIRSLLVGLGRPIDPPRPIHPGVLAIGVLAVYLAAVAFSDFRIPRADPDVRQIRYLVLMLPFLCVAAAVGADAIASGGTAFARATYVIAGFLVAISFLGVLPYCDASRFGADRAVVAAPEDGIGRWLAWRFGDDPRRLERIVEQASRKRTADEQEVLYASMGRFLDFMTRPDRTRSAWDAAHVDGYVQGKEFLRSRVPEAYRRHFE